MRGLFLAALFLTIISGAGFAADDAPITSNDASWTEYKKLLENYFFLDQQKAGRISCSVSTSRLQDYIDALRHKNSDALSLDENLHDFSVTYDRIKGLSFNSPYLKVSFLPDVKFAGNEQAENDRKGIEKAFDGRIDDVEKFITHTFDYNIISPQTGKRRNLLLTKNGDATVVSFDESNDENENEHIRAVFSGTTQEQTESFPTFNRTSTLNYQSLNRKMALTHKTSQELQGSIKENATESISYQDLGSAFFPAKILTDATITKDSQQLKQQHFEIDFTNCKTSDVSP